MSSIDNIVEEIKNNKTEVVKYNPSIERTQGSNETADLRKILTALGNNTSVTELKLNGVFEKKTSAEALNEFFKSNKSIKTFNCSAYFSKEENAEYWNFMQVLVSGIAANKTLQSLMIAENPLFKDALNSVVEMFSNQTSITHLYLSAYEIPYEFGSLIGPILSSNNKLLNLELYLSSNFDMEIEEFANELAKNNTLTHLTLFNCGLHDEYLPPLIKALENNTSLKNLILQENDITGDSLDAIMEFLETNKTIKTIMLDDQDVQEAIDVACANRT